MRARPAAERRVGAEGRPHRSTADDAPR
jgi:hypothetical protein